MYARTRARPRRIEQSSKPNYWRRVMGKGWTLERRARQAELIRKWKPWEQSTGRRTDEGKARTARNGFKGGRWRELRELMKAVNELLGNFVPATIF